MLCVKVDRQERSLSPEHYLKELMKRKHDEIPEVKELPPKKQGRPLLLVAKLDARVQQYIKRCEKTELLSTIQL